MRMGLYSVECAEDWGTRLSRRDLARSVYWESGPLRSIQLTTYSRDRESAVGYCALLGGGSGDAALLKVKEETLG